MLIWLRILSLSVHLLLVNLASAGPLWAVWLDARSVRRGSADAPSPEFGQLGRRLGWFSLAALAGGIGLGVLQGVLVWQAGDTAFFRALSALWQSKIVFGFWEIGFSALCVAGYLLWWQLGKRRSLWQRVVSRLLAVVAATNLLYHFPTLFSILRLVASGDASVQPPIDSAEFRTLLIEPEVIWFTLHFWLASFSVAGLVSGMLCLRKLPEEHRDATAQVAFTSALVPTLLQIPVGFVLTTSLNPAEQSRLMGGDALATAMFILGVSLAFWLMHLLASLALGERTWNKAMQAFWTLAGTILLMTATLLLSRGG